MNNTTESTIKHLGYIRIHGKLETKTGLHIGGTEVGLQIGGADNAIVRNGLDGKPYIPGSSLKGKMRCLLDRVYKGDDLNKQVARQKIHLCDNVEDYNNCPVCQLFGVTPEDVEGRSLPTRLIFRDALLDKESAEALEKSMYVDMPYSQVKTEVVIDRITSAATPRQMERVPAGVCFDYEIVCNIYSTRDIEWLKYLQEAMELLEHDYLGGQGSRGYGQVYFKTRHVEVKPLNGSGIDQEDGVTSFIKEVQREE